MTDLLSSLAARQLTRLAELSGKTVAPDGAKWCTRAYICLHFTDGSYMILHNPDDSGIEVIDEPPDIYGFYPYQLESLGLISQQEVAALSEEAQRKEREAEEQREREQYERLHRKFGGIRKTDGDILGKLK